MKSTALSSIFFCIIILFTTLASYEVSAQKNKEVSSLKGKHVIYVHGGWKGHKPTESVDLFVPKLRAEGAIVHVSDSLGVYSNKELMRKADLIIQVWTMGKITKEQFNGLRSAVINGTGFSGWHGGMGDAFRSNIQYQFLVGGQFLFHPGGKIDHSIKIYNKKDPITKGIKDFELKKTEQYYMLVDPNIEVLAISEFTRDSYQNKNPNAVENTITGSTMPVIWKKNYGKGRVFYSSIGHNLTDFDVPEVMEMQMRGFRWAAQGKYLAADTKVNPVYIK